MLSAPTDQHLTGDILQSDTELARDWLIQRVTEERLLGDVKTEPSVEQVVSALNREQKLSVLRSIDPNSMYRSLAASLVGDDLELYSEFLGDAELTGVHAWPLAETPTGLWAEKARLALDAGFSEEDVAGTAFLSITGWSGNESDMWERWIGWFSELFSHQDERVRSIGEHSVTYAQQQKNRALDEERYEEIYGF